MVASLGLTPIELLTMLAAAAEALVCSVLVRRERSKRRLAESDVDESRASHGRDVGARDSYRARSRDTIEYVHV